MNPKGTDEDYAARLGGSNLYESSTLATKSRSELVTDKRTMILHASFYGYNRSKSTEHTPR